MNIIFRTLLLVWQITPSWTIANIFFVLIRGTLPLLSLYLTKLIIEAITVGLTATNKESAFRQLVFLIGIKVVATLATACCQSIVNLIGNIQGEIVTDHIYDLLHTKGIEMDLEYYENSEYYDKLYRAKQQASNHSTQILNHFIQIGQNLISLLAMTGLLFFFNWFIAAILFISILPRIIVRLKYAGVNYRWNFEKTLKERRARYFSDIIINDLHAKEIRLFDLGHLFRHRFRKLRRQIRQEKLAINVRRAVMDLVTQTCAVVAIWGSYAFFGYQTVLGTISLGELVMYNQAFERGQGFFWRILNNLSNLYEASLFLSNLYDFLDLKPKIFDPLYPKPFPRPMQTGIVLKHVTFQYPNSLRKALEDISLVIRPGEIIALVGENGSGKTTLIKLLCRLYDPTEGKITLDGIDLRQFVIKDLRRQISVIFQDYMKYHLTARENIWFGNIDYPLDDDKIIKAAQQSGADKVIEQLPQSYDSILGKKFEQGEELSIGQWQKVAMARAFLRESQIIALDEPTSSLDPKAEYQIFKQFRQFLQGQTAILISHRLSTVRMADRIYVLSKGKIIENGTHEELVQRGGTYAHLFETQARNYR